MRALLPSAFAIAMLGAIESLATSVAADGMTGTRHEPNAELIGLGIANLAAPLFGGIADEFLAFVGGDRLVAHNADFDFGFLNAELARLGRPSVCHTRKIDTLLLARTRFPGLPNSLDALCRRFGIDLSERTSHNALLDCRLLAEVYIELTGGRQRGLTLISTARAAPATSPS